MPVTRAIVLSRENVGEADRYIQFLTRDYGMITVLAKSARKSKRRYVGGLDIFCHDELTLRGDPRERPYLTELTVLNAFTGLRDNLDRVMTAGNIVQWVRRLAGIATPMPAVYSLLGQTLAVLEKEQGTSRLRLLDLVFRLKLLSALGLKPRMESCARCEATDDLFLFDMEAGSVVCHQCHGTGPTAAHLGLAHDERSFLAVADRVRLTSWEMVNLPESQTSHLTRLITQFASFHTHVRLP